MLAASKNSKPFRSYLPDNYRRGVFNTFSCRLTLVKNLQPKYFLPRTWFRDDWSRDIGNIFPSQILDETFNYHFYSSYWHIIGIHISGNLVKHFETAISLLNSTKRVQNLFSNSSSKSVLSKTCRPRLKIPNSSKVIFETITEDEFSTHFQFD